MKEEENVRVRIADGADQQTFAPTANELDLAKLFGKDEAQPKENVCQAARAYLDARKQKEHQEEVLKLFSTNLNNCEEALLLALAEAGVASIKVEDDDGRLAGLSAATSDYYSLPAGSLDN